MQDNFSTHEFVRWLQPANTCDVTAPERGPVALTDVARVSTILIRGGYLIRQSTLGKTMATDDKKTSPAPKNGAAEKKRSLRKKTRTNRRTRRRQMQTDRRLRAVRKLPAHPQVTVGARAKNPFRKHIGITGTLFSGTRKRRSGNGSMVSLYLSESKANFALKYESVAVKLSLDRSIEEAKPNLSSPSA
jgi:hypothetical protein